MSASVKSSEQDPCNKELNEYTECVKRYPGGLKENDCEDVKAKFKECMKKWRSSTRTIAS